MALWSAQSLTETSPREFLRGYGWPARKADSLTAICEPTVKKCESLDVSKPYGFPRPVRGIVLTLLYFFCTYVIKFILFLASL
jgi:hypothetical protein